MLKVGKGCIEAQSLSIFRIQTTFPPSISASSKRDDMEAYMQQNFNGNAICPLQLNKSLHHARTIHYAI